MYRLSPDVSSINVTWSFKMENCTWYKLPVSGRISKPYTCPSLLHSAFFRIDWQAGTERSWELTA